MKEFNKEEFEKLYHENMSIEKTRKIMGYSRKFVDRMAKEGRIIKISLLGRHITKEHKTNTSIGVKKFFKKVGKNNCGFKNINQTSIPCEHLKSVLRKNGFDFVEEHQCFSERFYRLDIAFPLKMICFEINGNFHYDNHGKLNSYYQERHDFITSKGWNVIEIPHMMVYNEEYVNHLISILNDNNCIEDRYEDLKQELIKKEKEKHICPICGGEKKTAQAKVCDKCYKKTRKNKMMSLDHDELIDAISGKTMTQIAVEFKTNRSMVVKMLRKILPEYKNYINNCNDTKDLSFLTDEQLTGEIINSTMEEIANKFGTTKSNIYNELKKRKINARELKKIPIPERFVFEGISQRELSRTYDVSRSIIKRWIKESQK